MRRLFASILLFVLAAAAPAVAQDIIQVRYAGELVDGDYVPISGVFPLTFQLFESAEATEPVWSELQFVAAWEGGYDVLLGDQEPLDATLAGSDMVLSIVLGELGEVVRQPIRLEPHVTPEPEASDMTIETHTFADEALIAMTADRVFHARECTRFNGRTLAEIDQYDEMLARVAEMRGTLARGTRATLGSETSNTRTVGAGRGGRAFEQNCPPNYVVTGFQGNHDQLVNSVRIVCQPLQ